MSISSKLTSKFFNESDVSTKSSNGMVFFEITTSLTSSRSECLIIGSSKLFLLGLSIVLLEMESTLDKVLSISGRPGLFKLVTQTRNGFIAESLIDKKKLSVSMQHNVSILSEIAIYTLSEELPLKDVFNKIKVKENGKKTSISHKESKDKLEEYFFEVLPDYDEDRVYASDIKKIIQWYNLLEKHNMLNFEETVKTSDEEE